MPELPEVETTRRGIMNSLLGQQIASVCVRNPRLRWPINSDLADRLTGQTIHRIDRRAKYLIFTLDEGYILVHLGMSGHLRLLDANQPPGKHDHVDLITTNGTLLRYNDPRRFGTILWYADTPHPLLAKLGPEPLDDTFDGEYLYRLSRGKNQAIKTFIMDQAIVVGVGNIYASESLYKAGIHPKRAANNVSLTRYKTLSQAIKTVLAAAIDKGGTTLKDFKQAEGKPGYFSQELTVYGRDTQPCLACQHPIKKIQLGQRSTFFCPHCQR